MFTQEQRDGAYSKVALETQNLYASSEVGTILRHTFTALELPENRYREYVHIFGDAFLGLDSPESITKNLEMHFSLSQGVITGILQTLGSVIDPRTFVLPGITHTYIVDAPTDAPADESLPEHIHSDPYSNAIRADSPPEIPAPTTPPPHIPASRVMPQSTGEVAAPHDPKGTTALPNALLLNLKASLMHGDAPEEPLEGTGPKASYNSMLDQTPKPPAS